MSPYEIGEFPDLHFVNDWTAVANARIIADAASLSGKAFYSPPIGAAGEAYYRCSPMGDAASGARAQSLIQFKVEAISSTSNVRCLARGANAAYSNRSGVAALWDGFGGGSILLLRWVNGSLTFIGSRVDVSSNSAADTYMNLLLEVNGENAGATVKAKFWPGALGDEGGSWDIEETLGTTSLNTGSVGWGHFQNTSEDTTVLFFGAGFGEDAPRAVPFRSTGRISLGLGIGL